MRRPSHRLTLLTALAMVLAPSLFAVSDAGASTCAGPLVSGYCLVPGANLTGANLGAANLAGVDLSGANLAGANIGGANLTGAVLTGTKCPNNIIHGSVGANC